MVKAAPKSRKSNAPADFKRVKAKVGRKAPKPATHTDTSFQTRRLVLREQSVVADKGGAAVSSHNLTIGELLVRAKHHNSGVRREALDGLAEVLVQSSPAGRAQVRAQLAAVVTTTVEVINDEDRAVRVAYRGLLRALMQQQPQQEEEKGAHWCSPFFKLLMFHVCAGLSSIHLAIKLDALLALDLLLGPFAQRVIAEFEEELVPLFASLISVTLATVGKGGQGSGGGTVARDALGRPAAASERAQAAAHVATAVAVTRRTAGILAQFKQADKARKSPKAKVVAAAALGADSAGRAKKSGDGGAAASEEDAAAGDLWFRVAKAHLRFMRYVDGDQSGEERSAADEGGVATSGMARQAGGLSRLRRGLYPAARPAATATPLDRGESASEQQQHQDLQRQKAQQGRESLYALAVPPTLALWTQSCALLAGCAAEPSRLALCTEQILVAAELLARVARQSIAAGAAPSGAARGAARGAASVEEDDSGANAAGSATPTPAAVVAGTERALALLVDSFPAVGPGLGSKGGSGETGRLGKVNVLLARTLLRVAQRPGIENAQSAASLRQLDSLLERVSSWLRDHVSAAGARMAARWASDGQSDALERLFGVAELALRSPRITAAAKAELDSALRACLNEWFATAIGGGPAARGADRINSSVAPLLRCVDRYVAGCASAGGKAQDSFAAFSRAAVPEDWVVALPRIALMAGESAETLPASRLALSVLATCARASPLHQAGSPAQEEEGCWDKVARWVSPLLYSQTKAGRQVPGPFLDKFDLATKLQVLDLIAALPGHRMPESLLRALVVCTLATARAPAAQLLLRQDQQDQQDHQQQQQQQQQQPKSTGLEMEEETREADTENSATAAVASASARLLLSRLVQTPFVRFRRVTAGEESAGGDRISALADLVGFCATLVWGAGGGDALEGLLAPSDDATAFSESGQVQSREAALSIQAAPALTLTLVDLVGDQLAALQLEHGVPMAHLVYPVLFQELRQVAPVVTGGTHAGRPSGLDLGADLVLAAARAGRSATGSVSSSSSGGGGDGGGERANVVRTLMGGVALMVGRLICALHRPECCDAFPDNFILSVLLACCHALGHAGAGAGADVTQAVVADLSALTRPTEMAPSVELAVNALSARGEEDEAWALIAGCAAALRGSDAPAYPTSSRARDALQRLLVQLSAQPRHDAGRAQLLQDIAAAATRLG